MAKKETKQVATAPEAAHTGTAPAHDAAGDKAAKRAAKEATAANDRFVFVKAPEKGAPQMKAIVTILEAAGTAGLTRAELVKKMEGVVTTRQPLGRILSYYVPEMKEHGYISMTAAS